MVVLEKLEMDLPEACQVGLHSSAFFIKKLAFPVNLLKKQNARLKMGELSTG